MITIHAKNAKASEGKARLDEMAELKQTAPSTSNRKILSSMGSLAAILVYMRSFWSPTAAQAHPVNEPHRNLNEEELAICEMPDVADWRVEMARAVPKDKPTELEDPEAMAALEGEQAVKIKSGRFFLQDVPAVNLPTLSRTGPANISPLSFSLDGGPKARSLSLPFEPTSLQAAGFGAAVAAGGAAAGPGAAAGSEDTPPREDRPDPLPTDPAPEPEPVTPPAPQPPEPGDDNGGDDERDDDDRDPGRDDDDNPNGGGDDDQAGAGDDDCAGDTPHADDCGCDSCADTASSEDCDSCDDTAEAHDCDTCDDSDTAQAGDECDTCPDAECADDNSPTLALELVEGTLLANFLLGTDTAEEMLGHDGDDRIEGMGGDDVLMGGTGDDDLHGGAGDDLLMGEIGNDRIDGGAGDDLLIGGEGSDHIHGGDGDDRILGGAGDDIMHDGQGRDVILGGLGDDTIVLAPDAEVDIIDGESGLDSLDLSAALHSTHTDIARGEVRLDDGPADKVSDIEIFVAGSADDEFDFSGLAASAKPDDAPMFYQISDFGRGDMVRLTEGFSIGFDDFADTALWPSTADAPSDLETRMREASGEDADAVPSRLSFRTATEEDMVARVIDFDFDGDGRVDLAVTIQTEPSQDALQFPEQA